MGGHERDVGDGGEEAGGWRVGGLSSLLAEGGDSRTKKPANAGTTSTCVAAVTHSVKTDATMHKCFQTRLWYRYKRMQSKASEDERKQIRDGTHRNEGADAVNVLPSKMA